MAVFAALALAGAAFLLLEWRSEARRPKYEDVRLGWLTSPKYANTLVGRRITVSGDVGHRFEQSGPDYVLFEHFKGDWPWGPPVVSVRPRPSSYLPSDRQSVTVYGVLQPSPEGLLLVETTPPPVPLWTSLYGSILLSVVLAIPLIPAVGIPTLVIRAMWRRYRGWRGRYTPGICPTCGYDLRATPDRCPECGSPIPAKS
jgi:hypothetical protein